MRAFLFIYSLIFIAAINCSAQIQWEWANPPTTSNTLYAVSVLDSSNIIGFGEAGTMLKTTNNGESWFINYQNQIFEDINASHFFNRLTGIIACSDGKLYSTGDGGKNWRTINIDTEKNLYALDFLDHRNGAAAGSDGIVFITSDGGLNWDEISIDSNLDLMGIDYSDNFISVAGAEGSVFQTQKNNIEWVRRETNVSFDLNEIQFSGDFGIAVGDSGTALITKDAGESWEYQKIAKGRNIYGVEIKSNGDIICVSERGLTARANLKDLIWKNRFTGSIYDIHAIDILEDKYGGMVGQYGNLHATKNGFLNWRFFFDHSGSTYKNLFAVKIENDSFAIATGWNGTLMQTLDYGDTWFKSSAKGADEYRGIEIIKDSLCWAVGEDGVIRYSENRGSSWEAVYSEKYEDLNDVNFWDDDYGLIAGDKGTLFETVNGGNEWLEVELEILNDLNSITFDEFGNPFIAGSSGLILKKQRNSWIKFIIDDKYDLNFIKCISDLLITGGTNGVLFRSENRGENWRKISTGIDADWNASDFYSIESIYVAGNKGHLIVSSDMGITWKQVYVPTNQDFYGIDFLSRERGFLVGLHGTLLRIKKEKSTNE